MSGYRFSTLFSFARTQHSIKGLAAPPFPYRSVSATTEISACSQLPVARSECGLSRKFNLPTRPLSGGSKPDGCPSLVQSRHARQPSGVFSRTGKICTPAAVDARPLRRRNSGQLCARMRAARTLVTLLADSVSIVISRVTVGGRRPSTWETRIRRVTISSS
jgi:hypothetical protein